MKKWMQFLILTVGVTTAGALLASGGMGESREHGERGEAGSSRQMPPVANVKWKAECSGCHMLYHPGLLPERSWQKMMGGLDKHFGENATLDEPTRDEIARFLVANSADKQDARRSRRIVQSIPSGATPLRISETDYFISRHDEVSPSTFKRKSVGSASNCIACHKNADKGNFSESQVKIPR
jgi:hypothetical protein